MTTRRQHLSGCATATAAIGAATSTLASPVEAREAAPLVDTGYILGGGGDKLVERNAHALATLGVAAVAITRDGTDVAELTQETVRAETVWRPRAGEWTARSSNGTVLWWSDGRSFEKRLTLARQLGVHGVALWRSGSTDTL